METLIGDFQGKLDLVEEARFACIQEQTQVASHRAVPPKKPTLKHMKNHVFWKGCSNPVVGDSFHFEGSKQITNIKKYHNDCHLAKPPILCLLNKVVLCRIKPHQSHLQVLNSGMDVFAHNVETVWHLEVLFEEQDSRELDRTLRLKQPIDIHLRSFKP